MVAVASPLEGVQMDPAQQRLMADDSRVVVVNWHRQKGKDFTSARKAVRHAIKTGESWYIVSITQRQADETFAKCKLWARHYRAKFEEYDRLLDPQHDDELGESFEFKARELHLPNGGRVVSLPGRNPDALAGLTGNVIFTEFGLFPGGGYDHWRVVFPLTTRGHRVIVISTPRGKNTKFFELVSSPETYSVHTCDIHRSIAEGYVLRDQNGEPCSLETFKNLYGDESGWQREYECQFTGDLDTLIKWAKLVTAGELGRGLPFELLRVEDGNGWRDNFFDACAPPAATMSGRLEIGWDVARRGHLSSLWVNYARPGKTKALRCLVLMRNVPFELQRHIVASAVEARPRGVGCGDATGLGMDSNETLHERFGDRWEPVDFGGKRKSELGSLLATTFDDADLAIPPMDGVHKFIGTDLYAIQAEPTGGQSSPGEKRLRLIESENPLLPESHCDIAYSAALALRSASLASAVPSVAWV
ncbi:MAG: terminase family protein [Planctomycetota bacterium]